MLINYYYHEEPISKLELCRLLLLLLLMALYGNAITTVTQKLTNIVANKKANIMRILLVK